MATIDALWLYLVVGLVGIIGTAFGQVLEIIREKQRFKRELEKSNVLAGHEFVRSQFDHFRGFFGAASRLIQDTDMLKVFDVAQTRDVKGNPFLASLVDEWNEHRKSFVEELRKVRFEGRTFLLPERIDELLGRLHKESTHTEIADRLAQLHPSADSVDAYRLIALNFMDSMRSDISELREEFRKIWNVHLL